MKSRIVPLRSGSAASGSVGFDESGVIPALEHKGDVVGQWFFGDVVWNVGGADRRVFAK